jgi:hypothetical protein
MEGHELAAARCVQAVALKTSTHKTYETHWSTYTAFCLFGTGTTLEINPLSPDDITDYTAPSTAEKIDVRFTRFALFLAAQKHPTKGRHFTYASVRGYVFGARRCLSTILVFDLAAISRCRLGLSSTLHGLKYTSEPVKRTRLPITPQHPSAVCKSCQYAGHGHEYGHQLGSRSWTQGW